MAEGPAFLTQLVRTALGRGPAEGPPATEAPPAPSTLRETAPPAAAGVADVDEGALAILGEKVLRSWLRNRHQLLFPFALDLRRLDRGQATLLVHAMIAAAQADGSFDRRERDRIAGTLDLVEPSADERAFLEEAMERPKPLNEILAEVRDPQTGALVYAAALMAVDRRQPVNRYFLRYLSARLQLSEELRASLEQRYR
jgi:uncharacterized membrane protein YebE (DUF533 family)